MAGETHTICFSVLFFEQWTFTLAGVTVEPSRTYTVLAFNLPEPDIGDYRVNMKIKTPGKSPCLCLKSFLSGLKYLHFNGTLISINLWNQHKIWNVLISFLYYSVPWPGCADKRIQRAQMCLENGRFDLFNRLPSRIQDHVGVFPLHALLFQVVCGILTWPLTCSWIWNITSSPSSSVLRHRSIQRDIKSPSRVVVSRAQSMSPW